MATNRGFGSWRHLAQRFFGSLSPAEPSPADESWAVEQLREGELALWRRMSSADRRHGVEVARGTISLLGTEQTRREIVAAALLHDVGKVDSEFGVFARVWITVAALIAGRSRLARWAQVSKGSDSSLRARVGLYLTHDQVGSELLREADSHELTICWAAEHHLPCDRWTVDSAVGAALKAADGD
ncbi:MAG: hypothetical protein ACYDGN_02235 [Acidimicrobiales bacterium]